MRSWPSPTATSSPAATSNVYSPYFGVHQYTAQVHRFDGSSWRLVGAGIGGSVRALEVLQNGDLAAGGNFGIPVPGGFSFDVARWDGTAWHPVGAGFSGLTSSVSTLLELPNGNLVAAGTITRSGTVSMHASRASTAAHASRSAAAVCAAGV